MKKNNPIVQYLKKYSGILMALLLICVVLTFTTETFFTVGNSINILRQISINALLAFGMTQLIIAGGIDLSVGGVCALSGCLVVVLINRGVPLLPAVILAIGAGALCGLVNAFFVTRVHIVPFVVTLSSYNIFKGLAYAVSGGLSVSCSNTAFSALGTGYVGRIPVPVIIMCAAMLLCYIIMNRTVLGHKIYAVGGSNLAARYAGINSDKIRTFCYIFSGMMAAAAGIVLAAKMYSAQPSVGVGYEGDAIAASVLGGVSMMGGIGAVGGTLIGAIIIGVISNGLNLLGASYQTQLIMKGIIILIAVGIDTCKKENKFTGLLNLKSLLRKKQKEKI